MKLLSTCLTAMLMLVNTAQPAQAASHRRLGGRKLLESAPNANVIANQYIVVYDPSVQNVSDKTKQLFIDDGAAKVTFVYDTSIKGFSVQNLTPEHLHQIELDPQVLYIERVSRRYSRHNSFRVHDSHSWPFLSFACSECRL